MSLEALLLAGLPPHGKGLYLRNSTQPLEPCGARFACVAFTRSDAARLVESAGGAWLYAGPSSFTPSAWRQGIADMDRAAEALGAYGKIQGVIVDAENGWTRSDEREAVAMGQAMAELATKRRVGFTSFPLFPVRDSVMAAAGEGVWHSPQIYGQTGGVDAFAQWYRAWTSVVGEARVIPSFAAWNGRAEVHGTRERYSAYLAAVPQSSGAIGWTVPDTDGAGPGTGMTEWRAEAIRAWQPGGSELGTALLAARAFVARPAGLAVIGLALALVASLVAAAVASEAL